MRVLIATKPHLPVVGGGQMTVHWLALALRERGHEVTVLSVGYRRAGVAGTQATPGAEPEGDSLGYPLVRLADASEVTPALLGRLAADAAIVNGFHSKMIGWGIALLDLLSEVPTALYLHDSRALPIAPRASRLAAVSRYLAVRSGPGAVAIPPIVDRAHYRVATTRERVLFVNPVPAKGLATALDLARARPDVPFTFLRCWRAAPRALASLRRSLRGLDNVELREAATEPRTIYGDARVLIVPSVGTEAWGRVAREAQTSGIPVLAARQGGLPEAVGAGGALVAPGAGPDAWLRSLSELWDDPRAYAEAVRLAERQGADRSTAPEAAARAFELLLEPAEAGSLSRSASRSRRSATSRAHATARTG